VYEFDRLGVCLFENKIGGERAIYADHVEGIWVKNCHHNNGCDGNQEITKYSVHE
jgi:hypothetical protein